MGRTLKGLLDGICAGQGPVRAFSSMVSTCVLCGQVTLGTRPMRHTPGSLGEVWAHWSASGRQASLASAIFERAAAIRASRPCAACW